MLCSKCHKVNEDNADYCEKCGAGLKKQNKNSDKTIYILIIAIFIIAGVVGAGLIIAFSNNDSIPSVEKEAISYQTGFPVSRAPELASIVLNAGDFETIQIDSITLTKNQCLYILSKSVEKINVGESGYIPIKDYNSAAHPQGRIYSETIARENYVDMASRTSNWMDNHGTVPNYVGIYTPGVNDVSPNNMLKILAKILVDYEASGELPQTVSF